MSAGGFDGAIFPVSPWRVNGPSWKHPALWTEGSALVFEVVPVRVSRVERRRFRDGTTTRRGGLDTAAVGWTFRADPPDPELVVRRVGRLARIEDLAGVPYSEPMPIPEAISTLREIIE